jgi:periplasmic protein TonB
MEIKKHPRKELDNYSKIFFQIGIVLTLFIVYSFMEYKTYEKTYGELETVVLIEEMSTEIPIVKVIKIKPTQKRLPPPPSVENIEVVKNDVEVPESIIESTETDENEAITDAVVTTDDIVEIAEEETIVEDVPFMMIQDVPVYPGCKGNNEQLKKCFNKKVATYFGRNFDAGLASELGLSAGKKNLYVVFTISNKGDITNIRARGPHPALEKEVIKITQSLPRMTPGKQRGIPVGVSYSIPVTFEIVM